MSPFKPTARTGVKRLESELAGLFARAEGIRQEDEVAGDLNRYICVRVSGFLEQSLTLACQSLCSSSAFKEGQSFALSFLDRAPNPRASEIVRLVKRFSSDWAAELETLLDTDERGQRLNALVGIRNDIAHGKNQGVSRTQAHEYYILANEITEWLLDKFEPLPLPTRV